MANFLVSFRIASDSTYQERYESLDTKVRQIATGFVWEETSSIYIFEAAGTAESVCSDLYYQTKLLAPRDKLLVIDLGARKHAQFGAEYPSLLKGALGF